MPNDQPSEDISKKTYELSKLIREQCPPIPADMNERIMAELDRIISMIEERRMSPTAMLEQVMKLMYRFLNFSEIAIALRNPHDRLFKYIAFAGMRKEAENAYRRLGYTYDDVTNQSKYPRIKCTDLIDFFPTELRPYMNGEEDTYNRPGLLGTARTSIDNLHEGDYFCAYLMGQRNELIGWVELSRTKDGKFPSGNSLKWVNLICRIIGKMIG